MPTFFPVRARHVSPSRLATWLLVFAAAFLASAFAPRAEAATRIIHVRADASAGGNGATWATAYSSLQDALAAAGPTAEDPVEIWIKNGLYRPTSGTDRTQAFVLKSFLTLRGGFTGAETSAAQRPDHAIAALRTILTADIGAIQTDAFTPSTPLSALATTAFHNPGPRSEDNAYNVLRANGVTAVVLDRLVVSGGSADNPAVPFAQIETMIQPSFAGTGYQQAFNSTVSGGGLAAFSSQINVTDCVFVGNFARGLGGAISLRGGVITLERTRVVQNSSGFISGGIAVQDAGLDIHDSHLYGNVSAHLGGALFIQASTEIRMVKSYQSQFLSTFGTMSYAGATVTTEPVTPPANLSLEEKLLARVDGLKYQALNFDIGRAIGTAGIKKAIDESVDTAAKQLAALAGARAASSLASAYNYISYAVTAVDVSITLAIYLGADPNDPFIVGWGVFSKGFNTYATPTGLATLAYDAFFNYVNSQLPQPTFATRATPLRVKDHADNHNTAAPVVLVRNVFEKNYAGGFGGAAFVTRANVRFENSRFVENAAGINGGAGAFYGYNRVDVENSAFIRNRSAQGHSALSLGFRTVNSLLNNAFVGNVSDSPGGHAIGVEAGADLFLLNSVLWANTNPLVVNTVSVNANGGADLFAARRADLDAAAVKSYDAAGDMHGLWTGVADIQFSNIQSLARLSLGTELFAANTYAGNENFGPDFTVRPNMGDGIRPSTLDPAKGNFAKEPMLLNTIEPHPLSPLVNAGSPVSDWLLHNKTTDLLGNPRIVGLNVYGRADVGPVESTGNYPAGTTLHVNHAATGTGDGLSWANAFTTVQAALNAPLPPGGVIWVAKGAYNVGASSPSLKSGVSLIGGFVSGATSLDQSDPSLNVTTITGTASPLLNGLGRLNGDSAGLLSREAFIELISQPRVVRGLRFTGVSDGAAVRLTFPCVVDRCTFAGNAGGRALSLESVDSHYLNFYNGTARVLSSDFTGNTAGAIENNILNLDVLDCRFYDNTAVKGGAFWINSRSPLSGHAKIERSVFVGNASTADHGGAIHSNFIGLQVAHCIIVDNTATLASGDMSHLGGAGLWIERAGASGSFDPTELVLTNSILYGNRMAGVFTPTALELQQLGLPGTPFDGTPALKRTLSGNDIEGLAYLAPLDGSAGNVDYDPFFLDPDLRDFRLADDSLLRNQGVAYDSSSDATTAIGTPDIGVIENSGTAVNPLLPAAFTALQPTDSGRTFTFALTGSTSGLSGYAWEVSRPDGAGFVPVVNNLYTSGAGTATITLVNPPHTWNGSIYRLRAAAGGLRRYSVPLTLACEPSILYVKSGGAGIQDGTTWSNALPTLDGALNISAPYTQIWVAAGTYARAAQHEFAQPASGLRLYGGFAGTETSRAERVPGANVTTLHTDASRSIFVFSNSYSYPSTPTATPVPAIVDNVTVTGSPSASLPRFSLLTANVRFQSVRFLSEDAPAIKATGGSRVVLDGCEFDDLSVIPVVVSDSTLEVVGSTFTDNGITTYTGLPDYQAGAIHAKHSALTITDSDFSDNSGETSGALLLIGASPLQIQRCSFTGNRSRFGGGAINTRSSSPGRIVNTLFASNSTQWFNPQDGGAVYHDSSAGAALSFDHVTFADNSADRQGGALSSTSATIQNSVVWGNSGPQLRGAITVTNSLVGDGSDNADPIFVGGGDYHLTHHSPALNRGVSTDSVVGATDLDGNARRYANGLADLGAYEFAGGPNEIFYIAARPRDQSVYIEKAASFSASSPNGQNTTFVWEYFDGFIWTDVSSLPGWSVAVSGGTTTLSTPSVVSSLQVRARITGSSAAVFTANLVVKPRRILRVDTDVASPGDGSSWSAAYATLDAAIAQSDEGTDIWMAAGDYRPSVYLNFVNGVRVYGGFAGTETALSQRDPVAHRVIFRAASGAARTLTIAGALDRTTLVDGVTFTDSGSQFGLAVSNGANLAFNNVVFRDATRAVAVFSNANPLFSACRFENNADHALSVGNQSTATVEDSVFLNNPGAPFTAVGGANVIRRSSFVGNTAPVTIQQASGSLLVERVVVTGNSGGIGSYSAPLTVRDSLVADNTGTAINVTSSLVVLRSTIAHNHGVIGGILVGGGNASITDSILWRNTGTQPNTTRERQQIYLAQAFALSVNGSTIDGLATYANRGANNSSDDPLFVDPANGDYSLAPLSPAIDAATATPDSGALDALGQPRVSGAAADRGALESPSAASATPLRISHDLSDRVTFGESVAFHVATTLAVTWQISHDNGASFADITADATHVIAHTATSSTLTLSDTALADGALLRFVLSGAADYTSPSALLVFRARAIVYVDASATGTADGTTWADAYADLSAALAAAPASAEFRIAAGTYRAPANGTFPLTDRQRLLGGYPAGGGTRDIAANRTILSGAVGATIHQYILTPATGVGLDANTLIEGLVFRDGGKAIALANASPVIRACRFENLPSSALVASNSDSAITDCVFTGQRFSAISATGAGTLAIERCVFTDNTTPFTAVANHNGGALALDSGVAALVADSTFTANQSRTGGAIHVGSAASLVVLRSTFADNISSDRGAAIGTNSFTAAIDLRDSLFVRNASGFGGALDLYVPATLTNVTLAANTGRTAALSANAAISLRNSILWANTATTATGQAAQLTAPNQSTLSHNLIEGLTNLSGSALLPFDPRFVNAAAGDFRLAADSPAIDAGLDSVLLADATDLLGATRSQSTAVDLGAYEAATAAAPTYVFNLPATLSGPAGTSLALTQAVPPGYSGTWQYWNGTAWVAFTSEAVTANNRSTLTLANPPASLDGRQIRFVLTAGAKSYVSGSTTVSITPFATIFVDASRPASGDGTTWATAFKTLPEGLSALNASRRVLHVAEGTYAALPGQSFNLPLRVTLLGGFPAGGGTRDVSAHETLFTGTAANVLTFDASSGSATPEAELDGVTIADGLTGVRIANASPTLRHVTVRDHTTGGLVLSNSSAVLESCAITGNTATNGGGLQVTGGSPVFTNVAFRGNTATSLGGAALLHATAARFENVLATGNLADTGGAFHITHGSVQFLHATIADNRARLTGGVHLTTHGALGPITTALRNSLVWGNRAAESPSLLAAQTTSGNTTYASFALDRVQLEGTTATATLFTEDPLFVAPAGAAAAPTVTGDYTVFASSPAIGRGLNATAAALATDLTGQTVRLLGTNVDLGAYEFTGTAVTPFILAAQPADFAYNRSIANALTLTATGVASYAWQYLAPGDTVWLSAAGLPGVTGADTASLAFTLTPPALHGYRFRALLTTADGHVFITSAATLSSYPSRYYVNPARSGTDDGDGLAWATAFRSLDLALATIPVDPSDTDVWITAGTHVPAAPSGFPLWGGLRLYGGFTGTETLLTERDPVAHLTVLAGTTGTTSIAHTETRGPAASALRLDGFSFTSAPRAVLVSSGVIADVANNTFQSLAGTALEATGGTVNVSASRFLQNQRGIAATATTLTIDRSEFRGNALSTGDGAALHLGLRSVAEIFNSLFTGNRAVNGGAIRLQGRANFRHVTIAGNYATGQGAALYGTVDYSSGQFADGAFSILNSIVFANRTPSGGALSQQIRTELSNYLISVRGSVLENWTLALSSGNGNGNTAANPAFLSPILAADAPATSGDFRLGGGSSVLDAGLDAFATLPGLDLAGADRKFGAAVDPGAYELQTAAFALTAQPSNAFASFATAASFTVSANASAAFQWQSSANGTTWSNLSDSGAYSGVTAATLQVAGQPALTGLRYRAVATFSTGFALTSQSALYTYVNVRPAASSFGALPYAADHLTLSLSGGVLASSVNASSLFVTGPQSGRVATGAVTPSTNSAAVALASAPHAGERFWVTTTSGLQRADGLSATPQVWEFRAGVRSGFGVFDAPATPASADLATALAPGDLDQDGDLDLVAAGPDGLILYTNDGTGSLTAAALLGNDANQAVTLGDIDADGDTDAAVVKTSGTVELWLNARNGTPALSLAQTLATTGAQTAALGDLDADGDLDLAIGTASGVRIWLNNGSGVFADSQQTLGSASAVDVSLGDANRDGSLDILVAHGAFGTSLWINNGTATFAVTATPFSARVAHRVGLLDADNDGLLDAVLARDNAPAVAFFAHAPAAFFGTFVNLGGGGASSAFAIGDTDGDGLLDFVGADATADFGAWTRQPGGTYARTATQPALAAGSSPVLADLDGDGALDLVRIDATTGLPAVSLYRVTPTRGDEDTASTLTAAGFTRDGGSALTHVRIESLPAAGTLAGVSINDTFTLAQAAALVFTPAANAHGLDSFAFSASTDGGATYGPEVVKHWILVSDTPDAVAPAANAYSVEQGALLAVSTAPGILANDVNNDAGTLAAALVSRPAHGALTLNADGTFTYQHDGSETRADSFTYRATNLSTLSSATATVTITVANVNAAPTGATLARDAAVLYTGQPAGQIVGTLSGIDPDPEDAGTHVFALVSGAGDTHNAAFVLEGNVLKTVAPLDFADGLPRTVRVSVTDASLAAAEQVITFSATQAPALATAAYETLEDIPLTLDVVAQGGASTLTYTIVTPPAHGAFTGTAGRYTYSPDALFHGTDSFVARVSDGTLTTADVTFTLTVVHVNHAPDASALSLTIDEDNDGALTLAATDIDGDTPLTFTIVQPPAKGTLTVDGTGATYTPSANANGADSFLYVANDGQLDSAPALASITITPVNDAPTMDPGPFTLEVKKFQYATFALAATDVESPGNLRYRVASAPAHGTVFIYGSTVTYEPVRGYVGPDAFTLVATDNEDADTAPATYNVNVYNPLPVATDSTVEVHQRSSVDFSLTGSDPEGERIAYVITTPPAHGTLESFGNLHTYTPDIAFFGADSLTFVVTDADGASAPATVTLNVAHVNVTPVAADLAITKDGLAPTAAVTLSATDTADDSVTYRIVTPPAHGTLSGTAPELTYTANSAPFEGTDTFTYVANDGETDSAPATVTLTFIKTVGAPVTTFDTLTVYHGLYETVNVLANDSDSWGEPLRILSYTQGAHGTVSLHNNDGVLRYDHLGDDASIDTFTYTVTNGVETRVETVHVTIASRTVNITNPADSGPGSLRDALATVARFADFPVSTAPDNGYRASWTLYLFSLPSPIELSTIGETDELLGRTALVIEGQVKIIGAPSATIARSDAELELRLFRVLAGSSLTLENLTLADGVANLGGALHNAGALTLRDVVFDSNTARADAETAGLGGALFNAGGTMLLDEVTFTDNVADDAGGLYQAGGTTTAARAVFSGHGDAKDFRNTGGATFIAGDVLAESPTAPWIDPVSDITARARLSRAVDTLLTSGQAITVLRPYGIPAYSVTGTSLTTRTLANQFDANTPQGEHLITLVASGDGATFQREVGVIVDANSDQPPVARDDAIVVRPYGSVPLTALALLNDEDPDGTPLYNIFLQSSPSSGSISYVQGQPVFNASGSDTSVTYNLGAGGNDATIRFVIQSTTPDVDNAADSGDGTLRARIGTANTYPNQAWTLYPYDLDEPLIEASTVGDSDATRGDSAYLIVSDITIDGEDLPDLVLRRSAASPAMRLFRVAPGAKLTLRNLALEGGLAALGGAIYNEGTLVLDNVTLRSHRATATGTTIAGHGGAIYNAGGTVTVTDSLLTGNFADSASETIFGLGGALYTRNGTVTLVDATLTANTAGHGGGVYAEGDAAHADVTLTTSAFSNADAGSDLSAITRHGGTVAFHNEESVLPRINGPWVGNLSGAEMRFTDSTPQAIAFTTNAASPGLVLSATSSNQAIIANSDLVISGEGAFRTLSAVADQSGPVVIRLVATSEGVSFDEPFTIRAYTPNFSIPSAYPQVAEIFALDSTLITPLGLPAPATDPLGLPLTIVSVTAPAHGTAVIVENGTKIRYTHTDTADLTSSDEFFYTLSNGFGGTATSGVFIQVRPPGATVYNVSQLASAITAAATRPNLPWTITIDSSAAGQTWATPSISFADNLYTAFRIFAGHVIIDAGDAPGFSLAIGAFGPPPRFFVVDAGATLVLKNLRLAGGSAYDSFGQPKGGAVLNRGTFIADHVRFEGNITYASGNGSGGALYNDGGIATVADCAFVNNTANNIGAGGAIYSRNGSLSLTRVTFSGNTATVAPNVYVLGDGAGSAGIASVSFTETFAPAYVSATLNGGFVSSSGLPVAVADTVARATGKAVKISIPALLANDTAGTSFTFSATSAEGATITRSGNFLFYPATAEATDTFTYTLGDAYGNTSTAIVTVQASAPEPTPITATTLSIAPREGGGFILRLVGVPGRLYTIQVSTNLADWSELATATADAQGLYTVEDPITPPPGTGRFYRAVYNN